MIMDDSNEFKVKLHELYNDKGITARLRTHLRQLILSELQNSNVEKKHPAISLKSRAVGSLIVEWLQLHGCHYTLSVLSSEIPSLADLPMLANEGSQTKLQIEEAKDILKALGLSSDETINEYIKYDLSLIICLLKTASDWKCKLEFKELPRSPRFSGEKEPGWCKSLRDIIAQTSTPPEQFRILYSSLYNLIETEVEECISKERRTLFDELLLRENSIKEKLKEQEADILSKLVEARQGLSIKKDKAEEEHLEKKNLVTKLMEEVQSQHQAVIDGLSELKKKEQLLVDTKKEWRKLKERENSILKEKAKCLLEQEVEIKRRLEELALKESNFREKSLLKTVVTQGTNTTHNSDVEEVLPKSPSPNKATQEHSNSRPKLSKQKTIGREMVCAAENCQKNIPIDTPTTSESSSFSTNETDETKGATLRRIKELREETVSTRDDFLESRRPQLESDSSSSESECSPTRLRLRRRDDGPSTLLTRPQVTVPYLREGCHSAGTSHIYPSISRDASNRYKKLLSHGDQNPRRLLLTDSLIFEHSDREATNKLREHSKILENLIQAARKNLSVSNQSSSELEKQKEMKNTKKIESLMEGVRSSTPNEDCLADKERRHFEIIQEESNILGAGEAIENNDTSVSPSQNSNWRNEKDLKCTTTDELAISETIIEGQTKDAKLISISPSGNDTKQDPEQNIIVGSLMQAVLGNDSDVSDGEIVSIGRPSSLSGKFWS